MATFVSQHLIQNEIAVDDYSPGALVITTNVQQKLHYYPPATAPAAQKLGSCEDDEQLQSTGFGQIKKPINIIQMTYEIEANPLINQRPQHKGKRQAQQVMSGPIENFDMLSQTGNKRQIVQNGALNNKTINSKMVYDPCENLQSKTIDWEQSTPVQLRRELNKDQLAKSDYQDHKDFRVRNIRTAAVQQSATLTSYEDVHGPFILMSKHHTHSTAEKNSTTRGLERGSSKPSYPQTQKSQRRNMISNGIFLPTESLTVDKRRTVAEALQRPALDRTNRTLVLLDQIKNENIKLDVDEEDIGQTLPLKSAVDKFLLDKNLSYAYEMNSRPTTTQNNKLNQVSRKLVLKGAMIREPMLNQQYLVSDAVMKQRLAQPILSKDRTLKFESKVRKSDQINQKIMDTSFGRIESTSPEKRRSAIVNQDLLSPNTENQPTSLLAASLYERTSIAAPQNSKAAQKQVLQRPKVFDSNFDPSFTAYQNGGQKVKSVTQTLTDKTKQMERAAINQQSNLLSEDFNQPVVVRLQSEPLNQKEDRQYKESIREESKLQSLDAKTDQDFQPGASEILFYGQKKPQSKQTLQVIKSMSSQKPSQATIQPQLNFQRVKAKSSRAGTSSNQKYAISDIQIQKQTGQTSSEALNQQLMQQQAYFQQQRALISQITHQNSKMIKEKAQEESHKSKQLTQTLRTKSSGTKKQLNSIADWRQKANQSPQQVQNGMENKFLNNRSTSFAKTVKQEPQKIKNKHSLFVETKAERVQSKEQQCLTADSVIPKKPLIDVIPILPSHTIQKIAQQNEIKTLKTKDLGSQEQQPKILEQTKIKEYIYADPGVNIGKGKYGPVDLIIVSGKLLALKRIKKESITNQKRIDHIKAEKKVLNFLHQECDKGADFIVKLYDTFIDNENICFVFEYLAGQDLFWVLQNEHNLTLGKQEAGGRRVWVTFYCAEILVALNMLHCQNIIYRDLKPDNIMIDSQGHVKLIDFGFSKFLGQGNDSRTFTNCGTLGYTAPEVIAGQGYSYSADLWSFGIVIAELLSGSLPFEEKNDPLLIQQAILQGDIKYQREGVDNTARDLLQQIFVVEPNLRISMERIKQHRFFFNQQLQADQNLTQQSYWKQIQQKKYNNGQVPYKPNPMKYQYLLQNTYERISNLQGSITSPNQPNSQEEEQSPYSRGGNKGNSPSKKNTNMLGNFTMYRVNKEFENF